MKLSSCFLAMERFFLRSWWVILFSLACLLFYEQGQLHRRTFYEDLKKKFITLNKEKLQAIQLNQELSLAINSQSDPSFVELTLMKVLGVVSEGQVKVYSSESNSPRRQENTQNTNGSRAPS